MGMFRIQKSVLKPCAACGRETEHAKRAPNYDNHAIVTFFTCFLWLPIALALTGVGAIYLEKSSTLIVILPTGRFVVRNSQEIT